MCDDVGCPPDDAPGLISRAPQGDQHGRRCREPDVVCTGEQGGDHVVQVQSSQDCERARGGEGGVIENLEVREIKTTVHTYIHTYIGSRYICHILYCA